MELKDKIADYKKRAANPLLPASAVTKLNEIIAELDAKYKEEEFGPEFMASENKGSIQKYEEKYGPNDLPKDGSPIYIHIPELGQLPANNIVLKYDKENFVFNIFNTDSDTDLQGVIDEKNALKNLNNGLYLFASQPPVGPSKEVLETRLKLLKKMVAKKPSATLKTRIKIVEKMLTKHSEAPDSEHLKDVISEIQKAIKTKKTFRLYEEWENDNYHTENVLLQAYTVGTDADVKQAKALWNKHSLMGYVTPEMDKERYDLGQKLWPAFSSNAKKSEKVKMEHGGPIGCGCNHKAAKGTKINSIQVNNEAVEQVMIDQEINGFSKKQLKNINLICAGIKSETTGVWDHYHSGGGFYHIFVQLKDKTWVGFHAGTGDITLSDPFDTFDQLMDSWAEDDGMTVTGKYPENFKNDGDGIFSPVNIAVHDIKERNFISAAAKGTKIKNASLLAGRYIYDWALGEEEPSITKIKSVTITDEKYTHRDVVVLTERGWEVQFPLEKLDAFLNYEEIKIKGDKDPSLIQLKK